MKIGKPGECRQVQPLLDEYSTGELDAMRHNAIDKHLAGCEACRAQCTALSTTRQTLANYPQVQASPDFDMRVLDQLQTHSTGAGSLFDRLDAIFARPLYKLLGSAMLSIVLGLLTVAAVVGPGELLKPSAGAGDAIGPAQPLRAEANLDEVLDRFYASGRIYPESPREPNPSSPSNDRVIPQGGEPAWKPSRKSSPNASDYSFSAPSGSSC